MGTFEVLSACLSDVIACLVPHYQWTFSEVAEISVTQKLESITTGLIWIYVYTLIWNIHRMRYNVSDQVTVVIMYIDQTGNAQANLSHCWSHMS